MGLWTRKRTRRTAALIDIGSQSVAGAYAELGDTGLPAIHYAARLTIDRRKDESVEDAMLRTLGTLCELLVREGAPTLRRETGSGHADSVLVSVAAPWQDTVVRTESFQEKKPFLITKQLVRELADKAAAVPEDRVSTGESVIATILNGYEVGNPFGKRATRAELVVLSSSLEKRIVDEAGRTLRKAFHAHAPSFVSFAPVAYAVFRDLYPHEKDYLILDVSGEGSDAAFIKNGLLVAVGSIKEGACGLLADIGPDAPKPPKQARKAWASSFVKLLGEFAGRHPLPRTVFVLVDEDARDCLLSELDAPAFHALWLSDEPLRIVPVLPGQFASSVQVKGAAIPDSFLAVLALYASKGVEPLAEALPPAGPAGTP